MWGYRFLYALIKMESPVSLIAKRLTKIKRKKL